LESEAAHFRKVADGAITDKAHSAKSTEDSSHDLTAMSGVFTKGANFLEDDDSRLGRLFQTPVEFYKCFEAERFHLRNRFHLCGNGISTHAPKFRKQATDADRSKSSFIRTKM
jgi:hypothetical protein